LSIPEEGKTMVLKKLFFIQATRIFLFFLLLNIFVWQYLQLEFVESNQWLPGAGFLILLLILVFFTTSWDSKFEKTFKSSQTVIYLQCRNKIHWKILFIVNLFASTLFYAVSAQYQSLTWYFLSLSLSGASWLLVGLLFIKTESAKMIKRIQT